MKELKNVGKPIGIYLFQLSLFTDVHYTAIENLLVSFLVRVVCDNAILVPTSKAEPHLVAGTEIGEH